MKKFLTSALAIALFGSSIASFADDHSSHGSHGQPNGMNSTEMLTMRQDMQKRMSAAKNNEERQALMAEQQKLMQGKHDQMMAMHSEGRDMSGHMIEHQQLMQKHMGSMNGKMPMGSMFH